MSLKESVSCWFRQDLVSFLSTRARWSKLKRVKKSRKKEKKWQFLLERVCRFDSLRNKERQTSRKISMNKNKTVCVVIIFFCYYRIIIKREGKKEDRRHWKWYATSLQYLLLKSFRSFVRLSFRSFHFYSSLPAMWIVKFDLFIFPQLLKRTTFYWFLSKHSHFEKCCKLNRFIYDRHIESFEISTGD